MTKTALPSFQEQLQQTLKFFNFRPSMYVNSPRVSNTHKFMLFILLVLIECFIHLTWYSGLLILSSSMDWFHVAQSINQVMDRALIINIFYIDVVMALYCVFSMWFITQIPEKSRQWEYYQALYIVIYVIYESAFTIWIGDNTSIEGVMLISATGLGMVLLKWRMVWVAFVVCLFSITIFSISTQMAWWQNLPRLYPYLEAKNHPAWGLSFSYLVIAKSSVTLYCISQVLRLMGFQRRRIYDLLEADALTNIANRRTIYSFFNYLWENKKDWSTLSVIYFDLDKFKQINDEYGHDAGDATLVCTAETLKNFLPKDTVFGRMGGEEFCIVLPNVGIEQAVAMAEQLRQAFEKQVVRYGIFEAEIQFTASLGIASVYQNHVGSDVRMVNIRGFTEYMRRYIHGLSTMPALPPALERIIKFSDMAMQQAKANGRNCVVKGQCYLLMATNAERR